RGQIYLRVCGRGPEAGPVQRKHLRPPVPGKQGNSGTGLSGAAAGGGGAALPGGGTAPAAGRGVCHVRRPEAWPRSENSGGSGPSGAAFYLPEQGRTDTETVIHTLS